TPHHAAALPWGCVISELRVSASRSRCRNLVGLNADTSRLPRAPMEVSVGGLGVGAWIADRSEWASPWGEVDHGARTGCFRRDGVTRDAEPGGAGATDKPGHCIVAE